MKVSAELKTPTQMEMKYWIERWYTLDDGSYAAQESALDRIFKNDEKLRLNTDLDAVLVKCAVLNDFYSTNIYKIYKVAKWICHSCGDIDERLRRGDLTLVDDIASNGGKMPRIYSFATKFCSHHNEKIFPIYDSYVHKVLHYFNTKDHFTKIDTHIHLRKADKNAGYKHVPLCDKYGTFVKVMTDFIDYYGLQNERGFKYVDRYLWQFGKENFRKEFKSHFNKESKK